MVTDGKKRDSIIKQFYQREIGVKSPYNFNTSLLKSIIFHDGRTYDLLWEVHSKQPIYYENHKIFMEKYHVCYHINGINNRPRLFYKLPSGAWHEKFEDALLSEFPTKDVGLPRNDRCHCFFILTAAGWLHRYNSTSGELLQKVFLSRTLRFKHLSWNELAHSIVIKSVISQPNSQIRRVGIQLLHLVTFCLFSVFPLQFVALLEITKNVFGHDATDATIDESLLCISHQSGRVKLYSLETILLEGRIFSAKLGKHCSEFNAIVGAFPDGLPFNVKLTSAPPVLFEVKTADHDLRMGGFPWHYIFTPPRCRNTFQVCSMDDHVVAVNGLLENPAVSIYPDKAFFHPDESGRIIFFTSSELRVFYLKTNDNTASLCEGFGISMVERSLQTNESKFRTSSGRTVRKRQTNVDVSEAAFEQTLVTFCYEDEIDVLVVLGLDREEDKYESNAKVTAKAHFYNNRNGDLLKVVNFKRLPVECLENNIMLDLDVLVNIRKEIDGKFSCYVYRLTAS